MKLESFTQNDINCEYISWLNDKSVTKFSNQRFLKHTRKSCLEYVRSFEGTTNLFFKVILLSDKKFVGTVTAYISKVHGTADIGIMLGDKSVWGGGIGSDAWCTLSDWMFDVLNIRKITGGTLKRNKAMISIMENSGMHLEAIKKQHEIVEGVAEDLLFYARFK